jgi:hypothetical protein
MGFRASAAAILIALYAAPAAAAGAGHHSAAPLIAVTPAAGDDAVAIKANIDIAAPRAKVWAIMTDCARAVREHPISWMWFLPDVRCGSCPT